MDTDKPNETTILNEINYQIRNQLNSIIGFSNALLEMERTDKEKEFLGAIKVSGEMILKMINEKSGEGIISKNISANSDSRQLGRLHFKEIQKLRILLVEDDILNVKLIEHLFAEYGMKADVAYNGKNAIEKFSAKPYDLLLMDIEMPEMNGYDTTVYIRETLKSNVPIIALTAHALNLEKEKSIQLGMNDYITKPIEAHRLFEIIYNTIKPDSTRKYDLNSPVTNFSYLKETMLGKKEAIKEMLDYVLALLPVYLAELNTSIENTEFENIAKLSHKIKSSVSLIGAEILKPILFELEINGKNKGSITIIKSLNSKLNSICQHALEEVKFEKLKYT